MRIPCRFLVAAAAAVALGGALSTSTTAVAATVRSGASPMMAGSLLASLPDPAATADDFDGNSVAVSGNLAAVGNGGPAVRGRNGVVYLYQRNASGWSTKPKATLHDPQRVPYDGFGWGLAAFGGTTVVVGSAFGGTSGGGAVYVYTKTASGWPATPTVTIQDPNATSGDQFGWSVAVSKTAIVVGSPGSIDNGTEYIYLASNGTWPTTPTVISPNPDPSGCTSYGGSVAVSWPTAVIGCPGTTTSASLAFIEHITASGYGTGIVRTLQDPAATAGDFFGQSVAVSGTNIVVGTLAFTGPHNVYVFTKGTSGWPSVPTVTIPDPAGSSTDNFGVTVSVSVSVSVAVIAVGDNTSGVVYLYGMLDGAWVPAPEATVPDPGGDPVNDSFGQDVGVSGATLIAGAPDTNTAAGAAYLFSS
ncbi:MAG TPA: hypothetical protein VGS19_01730 [Streptosporangiaceae bacterium]|nr:hypothetical protein [Streptosporangiaceae bacterium]